MMVGGEPQRVGGGRGHGAHVVGQERRGHGGLRVEVGHPGCCDGHVVVRELRRREARRRRRGPSMERRPSWGDRRHAGRRAPVLLLVQVRRRRRRGRGRRWRRAGLRPGVPEPQEFLDSERRPLRHGLSWGRRRAQFRPRGRGSGREAMCLGAATHKVFHTWRHVTGPDTSLTVPVPPIVQTLTRAHTNTNTEIAHDLRVPQRLTD